MIDLKQILTDRNLTIYGASQIIGAETDEKLTAIHMRLSRWIGGSPPTSRPQSATWTRWVNLDLSINSMRGARFEYPRCPQQKNIHKTVDTIHKSVNIER
jgi:hypothetical protein